ncbi:MAG: DUF2157 domain-containing protein [Gammaproteobacteria bacterium]|nr:DUF2157 domain-containing protein [Gammaproteobacteria bacterium]
MFSRRQQIIEYIEKGSIPQDKIREALVTVKVTPGNQDWKHFIDSILLWFGGLALSFSMLFFIAYNWNEIGRFAKFAMVESVMILAIIAYWRLGSNSMTGKVSLVSATLFLGVLLGLYGQTYQTGADPWQLFFYWAIFMLPWALVGRFAALWIIWIILLNISIVLYYSVFSGLFGFVFNSEMKLLWLLFIFNTFVLIVWELLSMKWHWLDKAWAIRLLAVASGLCVTTLVLESIFSSAGFSSLSALVWGLWMAALFYTYRILKHDLFMLAGFCFSGIVVLVSFLGNQMLQQGDASAFLILALIVIGLGAGSAIWLRNIHREWQS